MSANCPSCGAALPVAPGAVQLTCRYCQTVIAIERSAPPAEARPRTIYVNPRAQQGQAGARVLAAVIVATCILPFVIGFGAAFGGGCIRACTSAVHPYPIACDLNDEIEVSGNWEGTQPLVTKAGVNCKIHIKNAKIKAPIVVAKASTNFEITLENTTIETTDTMFKLDSNPKVTLVNSTLVSQGVVLDASNGIDVEMDGSTIESKEGTAIKSKYGLKVHASHSNVRGKKAAIDAESGFELTLKKGSEVTASEGRAIKATANAKIESEGGKITGATGALFFSSGASITGTGLTISAPRDKAIEATSSLKIDLTDSSITASADDAIDCSSGLELTLASSTVQGPVAVETKSGLKVKASKKTRIVGTTGYGIVTTSGGDITLTESAVEGGTAGVKADTSLKVKLNAGSRIAGKRGGILAESNLTIDGTSTSIEGGAGPAIQSTFVGPIAIRQSLVKGTPAIQIERAPTPMDLTGTRVEGGQTISKP